MSRAVFAIAFCALAFCARVASACTPALHWTAAQERQSQDRVLNEADFFYRGTIENLVADSNGNMTMTIRRSRTLWGGGAPARLDIPYMGGSCALPNLVDTIYGQRENVGETSLLKNGWGVTVIGSQANLTNRLDQVFILVDGASGTPGIVARFQQLRFGWRQPD